MLNMDNIEQVIREYLVGESGGGVAGAVLADDEPLYEKGIIDSAGVFALAAFLEKRFAIRLQPEDSLLENFGSVKALTCLVQSKLDGAPGGAPRGGDIYTGLGAAPGRASGPAHVLREAPDGHSVPAGAVLVLRVLHPHLAPLVPRAAALVVEEGALLQHATTVAREFGVPAVVGLRDATAVFHSGELLRVDGTTGEVTRGGPAR
jgi:phosphohistidine swiveling domain-containing protein/acyl carrier protein